LAAAATIIDLMDARLPGSSGLLGSLRGLADGLLGSAHDRLELLTIELHEEKYRLVQIFIWISAIVFLAALALVFVSFALVVLLWESARLTVVGALAVAYVGGLIATVMGFRSYLKRQPKPFAGTLAELKNDRECIRSEN
jgi:uncharacterized membrane protein YqjE